MVAKNWSLNNLFLAVDIVRALHSFQSTRFIPRGCNASFITLVPKKVNPSNLNDFRPISLIGGVYKILSMILANMLKKVLPSVINVNQSAFLGERDMLDSILVVMRRWITLRRKRRAAYL